MDCTIYVAKTKVLISLSHTIQLICAFDLGYTKSRFSHGTTQMRGGETKQIIDKIRLLAN